MTPDAVTSDSRHPAAVAARLRAAGCVFAEDEARLLVEAAGGPDDPVELDELVRRRVAGEPLEWLIGWVAFGGLRIAVGPGVFVPRRRTELLVREAIAGAPPGGPGGAGGVVVELCCGAAAVATVVRSARPDLEVHAADVDPVAVGWARRNLVAVGAPGGDPAAAARVYCGDLYAALPVTLRGRVDVLVANAPYVPSAAIALMPPEARLYEPRAALDGGADGLDVQRRVVAGAVDWLRPRDGRLLIETSRAQAGGSVALAERSGLAARIVCDEDRDATALVATFG